MWVNAILSLMFSDQFFQFSKFLRWSCLVRFSSIINFTVSTLGYCLFEFALTAFANNIHYKQDRRHIVCFYFLANSTGNCGYFPSAVRGWLFPGVCQSSPPTPSPVLTAVFLGSRGEGRGRREEQHVSSLAEQEEQCSWSQALGSSAMWPELSLCCFLIWDTGPFRLQKRDGPWLPRGRVCENTVGNGAAPDTDSAVALPDWRWSPGELGWYFLDVQDATWALRMLSSGFLLIFSCPKENSNGVCHCPIQNISFGKRVGTSQASGLTLPAEPHFTVWHWPLG